MILQPRSSIDAYNDKGVGVITIQSSGSYEYMAYQAENKLTISLKRPEIKMLPLYIKRRIIQEINFH